MTTHSCCEWCLSVVQDGRCPNCGRRAENTYSPHSWRVYDPSTETCWDEIDELLEDLDDYDLEDE